ncbi:hypothetical protein U0035_21485 [Niabella yanshanensis]|uniref:Uncharacterized protein n=2 Tax=Niabella yanshanensis TaxID=577386 RepID=A0ABZ0W6Y2_9BACT|nr:hypothetical protein U0035_21485 [Niabella yanshanensis]
MPCRVGSLTIIPGRKRYLYDMCSIIVGDLVKLLPPFSSKHVYEVKAVSGAYLTLYREKEHKDLVIYIKCLQKIN